MRTTVLFFLLIAIARTGKSQVPEAPAYPRGYFRNPLDIPIGISGNFGELRPNHFHMGLDIKTEKRENLPVHAAADGYIARVKIEPLGFGQAVYINHPNGYTTVYCHLSSFMPALQAYVKQQQYLRESWSMLLDIPRGMFPVKKGDLIARSGNAGGSQAPHLHFEIRSTADDVNRNPLLFGLPVADHTRPAILRLALYDRGRSVYEQSPRFVPIQKTGDGSYRSGVPVIMVSAPVVGFAVSASDTQDGSANANGIFQATLYDSAKPVIAFRMDGISYNDTRNINGHIDYKTRAGGGPYLQQLFELPGNLNSVYHRYNGDGALNIGDGAVHPLTIEIKDAYGNTSVLQTAVQYKKAGPVNADPLPGRMFYPLMLDGYEGEGCEFYIGERSLYDSVHIGCRNSGAPAPGAVSELYTIGAPYIPLHEEMLVRIRADSVLPAGKRDRVVMQRSAGSKKEVRKVEWQKDWAAARFGEFGSFQLVTDETPPEIIASGIYDGADLSGAARIAFTVKDDHGSFRNFRALLDGKWLCFSNDKGRTFVYHFDEKCPPGAHVLSVRVEDEAGNETQRQYRFTR